MTPDLTPYLERYRKQRLQGTTRKVARTNFFAAVSRARLPTELSWGTIKDRLEGIEREIAEELEPTPPPAA